MMRTHIMLLTSRADHGGGPAHVLQLAQQLNDRVELTIACPRDEPYWSRLAEVVGPDAMVEIGRSPLLVPDIVTVARAARRRSVDIVHSHGKQSGLIGRPAAMASRVASVHTFHGMHTERYHPLVARAYLLLEWLLSLVTGAAIAVSVREYDRWARFGCRRSQLHHIPNGVAIPCEPTARFDQPLSVAFVGRVTAVKNPELLARIINAAHRGPHGDRLHFDIVGDGDRLPWLRAALAEPTDAGRVTFHGFVDNPSSVLSSCQAAISTSIREGLPLTVLEAFAQGLPVAATDVDGNHELLAPHTPDLLFAIDDANAGLRALTSLVDRHAWTGASRAVRRAAETTYDERRMADATAGLYESVLGRTGAENAFGDPVAGRVTA